MDVTISGIAKKKVFLLSEKSGLTYEEVVNRLILGLPFIQEDPVVSDTDLVEYFIKSALKEPDK